MANFKGGFAFNNEAAKVEVEQAPGGTLISCVNPVTGESLAGANSKEVFEGTAADMGAFKLDQMKNDILNGNKSVVIEIDATALGASKLIAVVSVAGAVIGSDYLINNPYVSTISGDDLTGFIATFKAVTQDGVYHTSFYEGFVVTNGTAAAISEAMYSSILTKTTIYHHPMPE